MVHTSRQPAGIKLPAWQQCLCPLLLAVGLLLPLATVQGQTRPAPFVIVADEDENTFGGKWAGLIYTELFKRLGIPFKLDHAPLARRASLADEGLIDGEAARIYAYGATHPNLIRVEESILDFSFTLFTASPTLRLQRLEDLPAANLLVEYRRGILLCENTLTPLVPATRLSNVTSVQQGVRKLLAGRTDLYCDHDIAVQQVLHAPDFKDITSVRKAISLGKSIPTYPYIHKKHAALAPRLAATLKTMKAEGLIETYRLQVERALGWSDKP